MNKILPLWSDFYREEINLRKFLKRILCNIELLLIIIKNRPRSIIEVGTGTGALSSFLSWFTPFVIAIDNDKEVVKKAKKNCNLFGRNVILVVADAFNLPFKGSSFNFCFSQGFFEHFENNDIKRLIKEQTRITRRLVIFNVPSDNYSSKPFGNERLLSPKEWLNIIRIFLPSKLYSMKSRYCRIDIEAFKYLIIKRIWRGYFEEIVYISKRFS